MKLRQMASRAAATGRRWVATPMGLGVPSGARSDGKDAKASKVKGKTEPESP